MKTIELTEAEAKSVISFLKGMSDRLTAQHQAEHSGVAQFMLIGSIQEVDRLVVNISEQTEAQA